MFIYITERSIVDLDFFCESSFAKSLKLFNNFQCKILQFLLLNYNWNIITEINVSTVD